MQFERWSLPLIGEALLRGVTRREDFLAFLGIAPELLDLRLKALVDSGILTVETVEGVEHFTPTEKGLDLETAIRALDDWSRTWDPLLADQLLVTSSAEEDAEPAAPPVAPGAIEMSVLGTFDFRVDGVSAVLSPGSQRLLVFLVLRDRAIARIALAGTMWPDVSEGRAGDSLRSAIARLEAPARAAIRSSSTGLRLAEGVVIDLHEAQALAHRLVQRQRLTAHFNDAAGVIQRQPGPFGDLFRCLAGVMCSGPAPCNRRRMQTTGAHMAHDTTCTSSASNREKLALGLGLPRVDHVLSDDLPIAGRPLAAGISALPSKKLPDRIPWERVAAVAVVIADPDRPVVGPVVLVEVGPAVDGAAALALVLEIFKKRILSVHEAGETDRLDRDRVLLAPRRAEVGEGVVLGRLERIGAGGVRGRAGPEPGEDPEG